MRVHAQYQLSKGNLWKIRLCTHRGIAGMVHGTCECTHNTK
jgi:hypothetical protein